MRVHAAMDRVQIGNPRELATSPRLVVPIGTAPDGLPWLMRVDRSRELSTLFQVVPSVFGLARREDLPPRVRQALERDVASGLMGVHELGARRAFVARSKLKRLLGPTLFSQLLEPAPDRVAATAGDDGGNAVNTNIGAMASRDQDDALLDAVDRSIVALRAKRHLLLDVDSGAASSCSVRDDDRALRVPSEPVRPLAYESLAALGRVEVDLISHGGTWTVELADRPGYLAGLLRLHQGTGNQGGWLRYRVPRQGVLQALVSVARDVADLHARGRVHGDLAPGNLLATAGGVHAFDGLDLEVGAPATAATFEWAAPEQIVGHPVDARTDVFALGRIANAIVGGVVFGEQTEYVVPIGAGKSRHVKLLKAEGVFLDVTESGHDRAWQRAWQELLGRSVAYDRARRPADARRFADELAEALERFPIDAALTLEPRFGDVTAVDAAGGIEFAHVVTD
nr:hypothetical protein [Kofleriaceae bacterium]